MDEIEIIGIAASTIAIVLGGVWFIVQHAMNSAVDKHRLDSVEQKTNALPCERNHDDIRQGIAENKAILKRMEDSDAKMKELPCEAHGNEIRGFMASNETVAKEIIESKAERKDLSATLVILTGKVNQIDSTLNNTATIVQNISNWIMKKDNKMIDSLSQKNSPRKLNDLGIRILSEIKGIEFLNKHKETLFDWMAKYDRQTALDIENAAHAALFYNTSDLIFNDIKNYVYNAPSSTVIEKDGTEKEYTVSLEDVCFVLSLPLRDMYLTENPDIG